MKSKSGKTYPDERVEHEPYMLKKKDIATIKKALNDALKRRGLDTKSKGFNVW